MVSKITRYTASFPIHWDNRPSISVMMAFITSDTSKIKEILASMAKAMNRIRSNFQISMPKEPAVFTCLSRFNAVRMASNTVVAKKSNIPNPTAVT
jgi:hypothetical protein